MRVFLLCTSSAPDAGAAKRYYAHDAVEDGRGVIAPWYRGRNGQCDFRVRVAAETIKRFPWVVPPKAISPAPEYVFSREWRIDPAGSITCPTPRDWANGDIGQRAAYVISGLVDYYRYTGDPAAIAHISLFADTILDHCQTCDDHPWPGMLISVPIKGRAYGKCDPAGLVQLDLVAEVGTALARAYQITGNARWFEAVKRWADLIAAHRNRDPRLPPWNRYANPENIDWNDHQTGGVVFILVFLDELIRMGYTGGGDALIEARDAGRTYLRDYLLPRWSVDETWGRNYWDWDNPVQTENVSELAAGYLMSHPSLFPNWRCDARNILSLFLNRTSVSPESRGGVYSGAWAYPEASQCCGRSLSYPPINMVHAYAQYAGLAADEWAREMARRQVTLATYDAHENGAVEDGMDGGSPVAYGWFQCSHPLALKYVLAAIAWMPDVLGAARENHMVRSTCVVKSITYGDGRIHYTVALPAASEPVVEVLRLAFRPASVTAGGKPLSHRGDDATNGYSMRGLRCGDVIVTVRHDGVADVVIEGDDPQVERADCGLDTTEAKALDVAFEGSQVRVIGSVGPDGGLADVFLDGSRQLCGIDCWNPAERHRQVLYYRNGLSNGRHTIRVETLSAKNPVAVGTRVRIEAIQSSAATGDNDSGEGGGPVGPQRWIFGYAGREDYVDSTGRPWRPATEFITRLGDRADSVAAAWWTDRRRLHIGDTADPELYRYGVHAREFTAVFTVGPGTYHARLKFAETRRVEPRLRAVSVFVNGREQIANMDITATAGRMNRAVDVVLADIRPVHGVIELRFANAFGGEAIVQAIEVGPGPGGDGAAPVCIPPAAATSRATR